MAARYLIFTGVYLGFSGPFLVKTGGIYRRGCQPFIFWFAGISRHCSRAHMSKARHRFSVIYYTLFWLIQGDTVSRCGLKRIKENLKDEIWNLKARQKLFFDRIYRIGQDFSLFFQILSILSEFLPEHYIWRMKSEINMTKYNIPLWKRNDQNGIKDIHEKQPEGKGKTRTSPAGRNARVRGFFLVIMADEKWVGWDKWDRWHG